MSQDRMSHDQALDLALRWAATGVPAFPIKLKWDDRKQGINKEPCGGKGFHDATADVDLLRRRFNGATLPSGWCWGVGLHLGPKGWMALDVDIKGGARGDEELLALEEQHGRLPTTPTVITASGGSHVWLDKGQRQVDNTDLVRDHIEVRADGGFVVAPGVWTPWGSWEFDDASGDALEGGAVPAPAPDWIFATIGTSTGSSSNGESKVWGHWRKVDETALHPADLAALVALRRLGGHGESISVEHHDGVGHETIRVTSPHKRSGTSATVGFVAPGVVRVFTSGWWLIDDKGPRLRKVNYDADHLADLADAVEAGDRDKVELLTDPLHWAQQEEQHQQNPHRDDGAGDHDEVTVASDVKAERVEWHWPGRLPRRKVVLLDGDPGLGKSTLSLDITARLSKGNPMPDGTPVAGPVNTLVLSAEDGQADTMVPRLIAAGADLTRVFFFDKVRDFDEANDEYYDRPVELPKDLPRILAIIRKHNIGLVIIDPLVAFLGAKTDSHRDQDVRRVLYPLAQMADATGATILCLRHLNKAPGSNPLYRGGGSIGFIGAARLGLLVAAHPDDPKRRVLAVAKSNLAAIPDSLVFSLCPSELGQVAYVGWEAGTSPLSAYDLLGCAAPRERTAPQRDRAQELLQGILADGPVLCSAIVEQAEDEGISWRTMERAKTALEVKSKQVPVPGQRGAGPSWWYLPGHDDSERMNGPPTPVSIEDGAPFIPDGQTAKVLVRDLNPSAGNGPPTADREWSANGAAPVAEEFDLRDDAAAHTCAGCGGPLLTETAVVCWACSMEEL